MRPLLLLVLAGCGRDYTVMEQVDEIRVSDPFDRVVIDVEDGNVTVLGRVDDVAEARGEITSHWSRRMPTWEAVVDNGVLRVKSRCPEQKACATDLDLRVPPAVEVDVETGAGWIVVGRTEGDLSVNTGAGDVQVFDYSGEATIETDAGNAALQRSTGRADLWSGAGDLEVTDFDGERLDLESDAGTVFTARTVAPVVISHTKSGAIELHLDGALQRVVAETDGGAVFLDVPAGGYRLELIAESGDISLDGVQQEAGADGLLHAQTDAGSIDVVGH